MTKVINLFGGPGTGKSTTAAALFAELKYRGHNCELAREYAKEVVWEGRHDLLENQLYILAKQLKRQRDLVGQVDYIITDSPLLLTFVYCTDTLLHAVALDAFHKFDNKNVFLTRQKDYQPMGRLQTEVEARILDEEIRTILDVNKVPYLTMDADRDAPLKIADLL